MIEHGPRHALMVEEISLNLLSNALEKTRMDLPRIKDVLECNALSVNVATRV